MIIKKALSIKELTKNFGSNSVVDHLSFDILEGEVFGILGPNGAGKTTTIQMICGLMKPTSGGIFLGDIPLNKKNAQINIGLCPQELVIWPQLTCLEQLEFIGGIYGLSKNEIKESSKNLIYKLGLSEKENELAETLSGGMKRRLNIALALIHKPQIAIFDEPEAGLDPQSKIMVREFLKSEAGKRTIIFTTHNMDEADRLADRVAIMDRGKLLQLDTPTHLKQLLGDGDILEFEITPTLLETKDALIQQLEKQNYRCKSTDSSITIQQNQLIHKIPDILKILEQFQLKPEKMQIRQNTLEDVFIHLTGKTLRD